MDFPDHPIFLDLQSRKLLCGFIIRYDGLSWNLWYNIYSDFRNFTISEFVMLLKVRKNAQITLPVGVRKAVHLEDGDILDCEIHDGQIVLTPKKLIDKRDAWFWSPGWQKAEADVQKDIDSGNVEEFDSVDSLLDSLKGE